MGTGVEAGWVGDGEEIIGEGESSLSRTSHVVEYKLGRGLAAAPLLRAPRTFGGCEVE